MLDKSVVETELLGFLASYRQGIENTIFTAELPIFGSDFADKVDAVFAELDDLQTALTAALAALPPTATLTEIAAAISSIELKGVNVFATNVVVDPVTLVEDLELDLIMAPTVDFGSVTIDPDLGLAPGGIDLAGTLDIGDVTFGTNVFLTLDGDTGARIIRDSAAALGPEFTLSIDGDIAAVAGALGFLGFELDPDPAIPNVTFGFGLDIAEGTEATASFSGGLNLGIQTDPGTGALPSIAADVVVDYLIEGTASEVGAGLQAQVGFGLENITIDPGSLVDLFDNIFGQLDVILDTFPLGVAIDILTQELPVVSDISKFDTVADLVVEFSDVPVSLEFIDVVVNILEVAEAVGQLASLDGPIELGDLGVDFSAGVDLDFDEDFTLLGSLGGFDTVLEGALGGGEGDVGTFGPYLSLPIFDNPFQTIGNILLNGFGGPPETLIEIALPELQFGAKAEIFFPVGPVKFFLEGNFSARTEFTVGYDTNGFDLTGVDFLQGFFIAPTDPDKAFADLSLGLRAGGGAGIGLASVDVSGGVTGTIGFELVSGDGTRTRLSDLSAFPCIFESITGKITADLAIEFSIGVKPLKITERITIGEVTLANFNLGDPCDGPHGQAPQLFEAGLAVTDILPGALLLTAGDTFANLRTLPDFIDRNDDGSLIVNDSFLVTKAPVVEGLETDPNALAVNAFGYFETFTGDQPFDLIQADGGSGRDTLAVAGDIDIAVQFSGGARADNLSGGLGNDTLLGENGNDQLFGGGGEDVLYGGTGDDLFDGGLGADLIYGGEDTLPGDPGEDLDEVDYSKSTAGVTLTRDASNIFQINGAGGSAEGDRLFDIEYFRGSSFDDTIEGSLGQSNVLQGNAGVDSLLGGVFDDLITGGLGGDSIDGAGGADTVSWALSETSVWVDVAPGIFFGGEATGDEIVNVENYQLTLFNDFFQGDITLTLADTGHEIRALAGDDVIQGSTAHDTIFAGGGDDTIISLGQGDTINGGGSLFNSVDAGLSDTGQDLLTYETKSSGVTINLALAGFSSTGDDEVTALQIVDEAGNSADIVGFSTIENLTGSDFADNLTGDNGANEIRGLDGADDIDGGGGADTIIGGEGGDAIEGGSGIDWASYEESDAAVDIDLNDLSGPNGSGGHAAGDTVTGVENLLGSGFADTLLGNSSNNIIDPGLRLSGGTEIIQGRAGTDTLQLNRSDNSSGMTFVFSGIPILFNFDVFEGSSGTASYETDGIEQIFVTTGSGNDTIIGATLANPTTNLLDGDDIVNSGSGNDIIGVGLGRDIVDAGAGDDTVFRSSAGVETFIIDGGVGVDTLNGVFAEETRDIVLISTSLTDTDFGQELFLDDGAVVRGFEVYQGLITGSGNDELVQEGEINNVFTTGDGADFVKVNFGDNILAGGESTGDAGPDVDVLEMDFSSAPTGANIEATFNSDVVPQGIVVYFDAPFQEAGLTIYQDFERLILTGTSGNDFIEGISPNEDLVTEGDVLRGRGGDDEIFGGGADDSLQGGLGNDVLYGGSGDDLLRGGVSNGVLEIDELTGDSGADIFRLGDATGSDYGLGDGTGDFALILDYDPTEGDTIELAGAITDYSASRTPFGTEIINSDSNTVVMIQGITTDLFDPNIVFVPLAGDASLALAAPPVIAASVTTDDPFVIRDVVESTDLRDVLRGAIDQIESPIGGLPEVTNLTVTFEGDDAAVGLFENAPWCQTDGVVISTGVARQITGENLEDGTSQPGLTAASPVALNFQQIGVTAGNSAVFAAEIPFLQNGLQSITVNDSYNLEGAGGVFAGFDMDGIILSRTLLTSVDEFTDLTDPTVLPQLDVFDFSPAGTFLDPGDQNERFDLTTGSTVPAGQNLGGTFNGIVDEAFARLGQIDFDGNSANGGGFSLGDGGAVSFELTEAVETSTPLYVYVGEAFANEEELSGLITVSDRSVATLGDLDADLGMPGEEGDTSTLTVEFDFSPRGGLIGGGPRINDLFKIVLVSEELPENGGSLSDDIVSVRVNGFEAAVLSDGQQATLGNLALSPNGPFHEDLNLNLVGAGLLTDTIRADAYTEVITISGPILGSPGPFTTRNVIEFEVADRGDGRLDTAMFISPWIATTVTGSTQDDDLQGTDDDDTFFGLEGNDTHDGGCGDDTYVFGPDGLGEEIVIEHPRCGFDTILFEAGITPDDVTFFRETDPVEGIVDLGIYVGGTFGPQRVLIKDQYFVNTSGGVTSGTLGVVERLLFDDGTKIDLTGGLTFTGSAGDELSGPGISGTEFNDTLIGLGGSDQLTGREGDDTYLFRRNDLDGDLISEFEGEGFDTIRFGAGITADEIFFQRTGDAGEVPGLTIFVGEVGAATNVLVASQYDGESVRPAVEQLALADGTIFDLTEGLTFTGNDNIAGDIEELLGTQFADTILSDAGAGAGAPGVGPNLIAAGAGADRVRGSDGVDSVLGQGDDDLVDLGLGDDTADGGHGVDTLTFKNLVEPGFVFGDVEVGVIADLSRQGTAQNTGQGTDLFIGFENLEGSEYADLLTGDGSANTLMGQEGGDLLIGNAGDDTLEGGEGFDVVEGGPGADFLFGGTGGDVIEGDIAAYFGSAGPLVFDFGAEITEIEASSSAAVRDDVIGDDIEGVAGASDFSNTFNAAGLSSLSFFLGGGQADTFNGGSGVDQLIGLRGNDVMYGNDSGDALIGEGGNDELYGGAGADFFFFDGDDDQDTIHDLELGVDVIFFTGGNVAAGDVTFADTDADGNGVTDTVMSYFSSSITVIDHDAAAVEASAVIIFG